MSSVVYDTVCVLNSVSVCIISSIFYYVATENLQNNSKVQQIVAAELLNKLN